MEVSIVLPTFNDERRISAILKRIIDYSDKHFEDYEIIIVDDCSKDKTLEFVKGHKNSHVRILRNRVHTGCGFSVKHGVLQARKEHIIFICGAGLSTPIEEMGKLSWYLEKGYDIAFGSRNAEGADIRIKPPLYRIIAGRLFALAVDLIALRGFMDTRCGFKMLKKSAAREIFRRCRLNKLAFDVEILFIAKKLGFRMMEVPVVWAPKKGEKSDIRKDSIGMLFALFQIRINYFLGRYR